MFYPLNLVQKTSDSLTLRWNDFLRKPSIDAGYNISNIITNTGNVTVYGGDGDSSWLVPPAEASDLVSVASGNEFSVGIKSDGSLVAWGYSPSDALGESNLLIPPEAICIKKLCIRERTILALTSTGQVLAWGGWNEYGERTLPTNIGAAIDIAMSTGFGVALKADGTTVHWGAYDRYPYHLIPPSVPLKAIVAGDQFGAGLDLNNEVVLWTSPFDDMQPVPTGLTNVTALSAGPNYIIALKEDGTITAWGNTAFNSSSLANIPSYLTSLGGSFVKIVEISAGTEHAIALREDGSLVAWGVNSFGETNLPASALTTPREYHIYQNTSTWLATTENETYVLEGLQPETEYTLFVSDTNSQTNPDKRNTFSIKATTGSKSNTLTATPISDTEISLTWEAFSNPKIQPGNLITAGEYFSLASLSDNSLYAWGKNTSGQCDFPALPSEEIVSLHARAAQGAALMSSGDLIRWGNASNNMPLGLNGNIAAYATNDQWEIALKKDGTVIAWGTSAPDLSGLTNIVAIAMANYHILLLKSDGTLFAIGDNGDETNIPTSITGIVDIAAGENFSMVLKPDGTITAWTATPTSSWMPENWTGEDIVKISASAENLYAIGLKKDGTIVTWGTNIPQSLQAFISSNANQGIVNIDAGRWHAMLVLFDGSILCLGDSNLSGELDVPSLETNNGYIINVDGELYATVDQNTTQAVVSDLLPNTSHDIYVIEALYEQPSGNETITENKLTLLSAPMNLTISEQTDSSCKLSWDIVSGATSYELFESGVSYEITTEGLFFNIVDLIPDTTYTFAVKALTSNNESLLSSSIDVLILASETTPPEAPTNLSLQSVSTNECQLIWTAPAIGAPFTYELFLNDIAFSSGVTISDTSANIVGLSSNTTYSFAVKATNDDGTSPSSDALEVLTYPEAPTNLIISDITIEGANLAWTAPSGSESLVYSIYKDDDTIAYTNATITGTEAVITALDSNTDYTLTLRATNASGYSTNSITLVTLSQEPTNLDFNSISSSEIELTWTAPTGLEPLSYLIIQNNIPILTSNNTAEVISDLVGNTEYEFKVIAQNISGNSIESLPISILTIPGKPISFYANNITSSSVILSWSAPSGGSPNYKIYQDTDLIAEQAGTSITISTLTPETVYSFIIKASNNTGDSNDSNLVAIKTTLAAIGTLCYCDENSLVNEIPLYANPVNLPAMAVVADNNMTMYSSLVPPEAANASRLIVSTAGGNMATSLSIPDAPTGVFATPDIGTNTISWNNVTGASSYNLYWSNTFPVDINTANKIEAVTSPFVHSSLTNIVYYYAITAKTSIESDLSATVSAQPTLLITDFDITGLTPPVAGASRVTSLNDTQYTANTISWFPNDAIFKGETAYTATFTLLPKTGYTISGILENSFTVDSATSVTNANNSGTVSVLFPATEAQVVSISAIPGVNIPTAGAPIDLTTTPNAQYTGTISWTPPDSTYQLSTPYAAEITLTAQAGYTFTGVSANYFTVNGSTSRSNPVGSGSVMVVAASFPATASTYFTFDAATNTITDYNMLGGADVVIPQFIDSVEVRYIGQNGVSTPFSSKGITSISFPPSIRGIANYAFYNTQSLSSVTFNNGLLTIGDGAFESSGIAGNITIPDSVTQIGYGAFSFTQSLTGATFGAGLQTLGAAAFQESNIANITFTGSALTSIGNNAFFKTKLTSAIIPDSVTSFGTNVFNQSNLLSAIIIPPTIHDIDYLAFFMCPLSSITIGNNVTYPTTGLTYTWGNYGVGFDAAYQAQGKGAGTYLRDSGTGVWTSF